MNFRNKIPLTACILSILMLSVIVTATAQTGKKIQVLFLGNSYTSVNNLPLMISNLATAAGDTLVFESNLPGGYTFQNHYSNNTSKTLIKSRNWDYVVLQAQSQEPSFPPDQVAFQTLPYAIGLNNLIISNDSCTKTVFYETWGRKNGDVSNCAFYPPVCTYQGMQDRLKESYKLFTDTCHAIMAPAGEAWRKSIGLDSKLELYSSDQSHPALEGSYLTACVLYEVLFGKSVIGNTYTAGMLKYPTEFLQHVAHDVLNDSLDVWNIGKFDPCKITTSEGHFNEKNTRIYPNPVKDELIISSSGEMGENSMKIRITGVTGRYFELKDLSSDKVDVSHLPAGMYFLEILTGNLKKETLKFIKQ